MVRYFRDRTLGLSQEYRFAYLSPRGGQRRVLDREFNRRKKRLYLYTPGATIRLPDDINPKMPDICRGDRPALNVGIVIHCSNHNT